MELKGKLPLEAVLWNEACKGWIFLPSSPSTAKGILNVQDLDLDFPIYYLLLKDCLGTYQLQTSYNDDILGEAGLLQTEPYISLAKKDVQLPQQTSTSEGSLHAAAETALGRLDDNTKE